MLKLILCMFVILLSSFSLVHAQNNNGVVYPIGLYFGNQYYGEITDGIGYYYFNPDSSFIFIRTGLNQNVKTKEFKDRFNDTLVGYGKGRWSVKNNLVIVRFETITDENIQNSKLKYSGYSKAPFDSLFFSINVTNYDNNSLGIATITFPMQNIGAATDTLGFSKAKLLKSDNLNEIVVTKYGYLDLPFTLPKNFNVHELSITLAKADHSNIELVSKVEYAFKFLYDKGNLIFEGKLKRQTEGKQKLRQFVKNGFIKFPQQITFLQKIMRELN